jgi:hypothetical protein
MNMFVSAGALKPSDESDDITTINILLRHYVLFVSMHTYICCFFLSLGFAR